MAVPNIQPPPNWQPIGWSPNSFTGGLVVPLSNISGVNINGSAQLFAFNRIITDAQMKALLGTPLSILPACGLGFTWMLFTLGWNAVITNNGGTGVNGTLRYRGGAPDPRIAAPATTMIAIVAGTTTRCAIIAPSTFNTQVAADSIENVSIDIVGSANAGAAFATSTPFKVWGTALRLPLT